MSNKKPDRRSKLDYDDYIHKLSTDEQKWIKQFYQEWEYGARPKNAIIKDKEMLKAANRNYNSQRTEVYDQPEVVNYMEDTYKDFMEDASDAWEWQDAYAEGGYKAAKQIIIEHALRDLEAIDKSVALVRFYSRMRELDRVNNKAYKGKVNE